MAVQRTIVAVVDDNLLIRKAMSTLLSALGYCTELFGSGEAFLDAATRSKTSCIIVDIQLGDISSVELRRPPTDTSFKYRIIFMTLYDDATNHHRSTRRHNTTNLSS